MESDRPQAQQGLPLSDSAFPSSAHSSASQFPVPQISPQQFQLGLGNFPLQGFGQLSNPYLTATVPQFAPSFGSQASIATAAELQRYQQLLTFQSQAYTEPRPPSEENAATANTAEATPPGIAVRSTSIALGGRQQSVPAVRQLRSSSEQRSPSKRREKFKKVKESWKEKEESETF